MPATVHLGQLGPVVQIMSPVQKPDDPFGINLQGRHFLPEPSNAGLVGPDELRSGQLGNQCQHQLAFLLLDRPDGSRRFAGPAPSPRLTLGPSHGGMGDGIGSAEGHGRPA